MVEQQVRQAILAELERQAAAEPNRLKVERLKNDARIDGEVKLDELVMAILGAVAGGP